MFQNIYKNKRVLVTGHTGFKGSWLSLWLMKLGAQVIGYSLDVPSDPSNFEVCGLENQLEHFIGDVRDLKKLDEVFKETKPEMVFHLAAQPIVKLSYQEPILTFETNINGTLNILEAIRKNSSVKAGVLITSDKAYRNVEWEWGYRENDELGGEDPYSASKGCAELIARSYIDSFLLEKTRANVATVRAGNVIGGGDWALYRIIPDCVKAWSKGETVIIRNPNATRPWQHVLEPLSGYLWLGALLAKSDEFQGEPFNFGPDAKVNEPVSVLLEEFGKYWPAAKFNIEKTETKEKESMLLKLCCDKALHRLGWHAVLDFCETVKFTAEWYRYYYQKNKSDMLDFTFKQIESCMQKASFEKLSWAKE